MTPLQRKLLTAFAIAFACYTLAGFLLAPPLIRSAILTNLNKSLTTRASLRSVRVNPLALSMTLEDLRIPDADGTDAVAFSKLYVRFNIFSPFFHAWTLDELRLEGPKIQATVLADRTLNLLKLVRAPAITPDAVPANPRPAPEPPALLVRKLSILRGTASLEDRTRAPALREGLIPIHIELTDFSTRRDQQNAYSFDATTEHGEKLSWRGRFTTQPFTSNGQLRIADLAAQTIEDILGPENRAYQLTRGRLTFAALYRADATTNPPSFQLTNMGVAIRDLAIADRATGEEAIHAAAIDTRGGSIRSDRREANLGTLTADSLHVLVTMDSTGVTNLQRWSEAPPDTAPPWTTLIPKIAFHRLGLEYQDRRTSPPGILRARNGNGSLQGYSSAPGTEASVAAACSLSTDGYATASGTLKPDQGAVDLKLDVERLAATELEPFLSPFAKLRIPRGTMSASGRLEYNEYGTKGPALRFTGQALSTKLVMRDRKLNENFLSWDRLDVRGLKYEMEPSRVVIHEIIAEKPYLRFVVAPDLTTNIQAIVVLPDSVPAAFRPPPGAPVDTMQTEIGSVQIKNGSMFFADHTLTPPFATGIYGMNGSIRELSSAEASHAVIDIDGKVDEQAPVKIAGTINPLNDRGLTDVAVNFKNIELTTFTPYSGKFMGYRIERGKLDLGLKYAIQDRQLKADNKILMHQFTLGDKVDSKDATHLPVKFAIALLKDKDGNIDLDLPVHGSLDDPQFSVMKIVLKILTQLVVKAVTSPFKLFGAIFGGDGAESAPAIRFPYGSASLDTTEITKLVAIQKGLSEKPGLVLEIEQAVATDRDSMAIAERIFVRRIREAASNAPATKALDPALLAAASQRAPAGLSGEEYARGVLAAYMQAFGKPPVNPKPTGKQAKGAPPDPAFVSAQADWLEGMATRVRSSLALSADLVAALANQRARAIQSYLLQDTTLTADRLYIVANKGTYAPDSAGVRAGLTLRD